MSAAALAESLAALGVSCEVAARERLAVLRPHAGTGGRLADDAVRRDVVAAAKRHGFTHVALELPDDGPPHDAHVRRD